MPIFFHSYYVRTLFILSWSFTLYAFYASMVLVLLWFSCFYGLYAFFNYQSFLITTPSSTLCFILQQYPLWSLFYAITLKKTLLSILLLWFIVIFVFWYSLLIWLKPLLFQHSFTLAVIFNSIRPFNFMSNR